MSIFTILYVEMGFNEQLVDNKTLSLIVYKLYVRLP